MNVVIFGATGSAGGSVLRTCLAEDAVRDVRSITRRPPALDHPKLTPFVHSDFANYDLLEDAFLNVDTCFFCLGVSAVQVPDEAAYRRITVDYAVAAAAALRASSPSASFHYLSGKGAGADSRFMWARVKAEAEMQLISSSGAVCWRPGFIDGEASDTGAWYQGALRPLFQLLRPWKSLYVSGSDLARAMLVATQRGMTARVIENREIRELATSERKVRVG